MLPKTYTMNHWTQSTLPLYKSDTLPDRSKSIKDSVKNKLENPTSFALNGGGGGGGVHPVLVSSCQSFFVSFGNLGECN